jgi:hypothetical protein
MRLRSLLVLCALVLTSLPAAAGARVADEASDNVKLLANVPLNGVTDVKFTRDGYAVLTVNGSGEQAGLWVVDVRNPKKPKPVGHLSCAGSGYDVGLWRDIAVMSIDSPSGNSSTEEDGCNLDGTTEQEGIRLVDVSDRRNPREVNFVVTPCGSHTNVTFDHKGRGLVYVQSYPASTSGACPSLHGIVSVVDITDPAQAEIVAQPSVLPAVGCHDGIVDGDIAFFACLTEGQVWDVSDPLEPDIIAHINDMPDAIWHSTGVSNNSGIAVFGFESFGPGNVSCNGTGAGVNGGLVFYDVSEPSAPQRLGIFVPPRFIQGLCTAHNFTVIPKIRKDMLVTAWYAGGLMAVDFSDPSAPTEMAYFLGEGTSSWDAQYYRGKVYVGDSGRGLDILKIKGLK